MPTNQYDPRRFAQLDEAANLRRAWQSSGLTQTFGRALTRLNRPVGWAQPNEPLDVAKTQVLLDAAGHDDVARTEGPTGWGDHSLASSLESFQKANNLKVDGYANPDGETMRALAPYARTIAAKEGQGDKPKDPPKDDKPKPPPPSQPPTNPPAEEKPEGEKPSCTKEKLDAYEARKNTLAIRRQRLSTQDRIAFLEKQIEAWRKEHPAANIPGRLSRRKSGRPRLDEALDGIDTAQRIITHEAWARKLAAMQKELSELQARLPQLIEAERVAMQAEAHINKIFQDCLNGRK